MKAESSRFADKPKATNESIETYEVAISLAVSGTHHGKGCAAILIFAYPDTVGVM